MKKALFLCLSAFLMLSTTAVSKNLQAYFSYCTFYAPENGPYIETYLSVNGNTVKLAQNERNKYQGIIEVTLVFKEGDQIRKFEKYNLYSPEVDDPATIPGNFIDQQRISLPNGKYSMEIEISDKNGGSTPFKSSQNIDLEYYPNILAISDIELIESFTETSTTTPLSKSGFEIIPFVSNFYPSVINDMKFYVEIYNASKIISNDPYLVSYYISSYESKRTLDKFRGFSKQESKSVNAIMGQIPIVELPSGNYILTVEVRNKQNELLATKERFFQRSNSIQVKTAIADDDYILTNINNTFVTSYTNRDVLVDMIQSLRPISNGREADFGDNQMKLADVEMMQKYFYNFWQKRDPNQPEQAWLKYNEEVKKVQEVYATQISKGYETDRGRVYLQYGPPNTVTQNLNEPSAYPYEIWHYYKLETQSNRKFIFYNPDLVTNDFTLIHSDALGEIYDTRWNMKIHKRDTQSRNFDDEKKGEHFGGKSDELFTNPR